MEMYFCKHDRGYLTRSEATNCMHYLCWQHTGKEWRELDHRGQRETFNKVRGF